MIADTADTSSTTGGVVAAAVAPLTGCLGLFIWSRFWSGTPFALNLYKCSVGGSVFVLVSVASGSASNVTVKSALWLVFSGFLGIVVGDSCWLYGLALLGPRRTVFVDSIKPFMAAGLAKWWLGEDVSGIGLVFGLFLATAGCALVSLERARASDGETASDESDKMESMSAKREPCDVDDDDAADGDDVSLEIAHASDGKIAESISAKQEPRDRLAGWGFALANVALDTTASALTKIHGKALSTWDVNALRFGSAALMLSVVSCTASFLGRGSSDSDRSSFRWAKLPSQDMEVWGICTLGVAFTTFLAPALLNYALFLISLPVFTALSSLGPLYALPLGWFFLKERVSSSALFGAFLATAGATTLGFYAK